MWPRVDRVLAFGPQVGKTLVGAIQRCYNADTGTWCKCVANTMDGAHRTAGTWNVFVSKDVLSYFVHYGGLVDTSWGKWNVLAYTGLSK